MRYGILLLGFSCLATPAFAQSLPSQDAVPTDEAMDKRDEGLGEIVVTAQRRAENLQKSSLAIQVLSGDDLKRAGLTQAVEMTRLVPGLQMSQLGAVAQPYIRGVGNANNTGANDSGVAFNVDGVYIGQAPAYGLDFYDLARTEVLKGPQGTLYGRNATGGAVNLITNAPSSEFGGYVSFDIGNYDFYRLNGAINVPLSDTLSARGAFNFIRRNGYFRDGTGDDNQEAGRLRVLWKPNEMFDVTANVSYAHQHGRGGGVAVLDGSASTGTEYNIVDPWAGANTPAIKAAYGIARNKDVPPNLDLSAFAASIEANVNLGNDLVLTIFPAYRNVKTTYSYYITFLAQGNDFTYDQKSLEARLSRDLDNWKFVIGAYYFNQNQNTPLYVDQIVFPDGAFGPGIGNAIIFTNDFSKQDVKSYSAFGETTYSLTSDLRLIAGLRYTQERTVAAFQRSSTEAPFVPLAACSPTPCVQNYGGKVKSSSVNWKAGMEYDVSPDSMLYGTVSTGFKAGGVFSGQPPRNTFKPEKLLAFALGSRNRFLDNRLQINLEAFYWKYTDKQETITGYDGCGDPACGGSLNNLTVNAGSIDLYGLSADITSKVTSNDTLRMVGEYNHTEYKEFLIDSPVLVNSGCAQTASGTGFVVDCSGFPLTRAPKWSGTVDYQHTFGIQNGAEVIFGASVSYASSRYLDPHFLGMLKAPSYTIVNSDLTYESPSKVWSVTAYIRNIGDTVAPVTAFSLNDTATIPFVDAAVLNPPRTYGVRANFNF